MLRAMLKKRNLSPLLSREGMLDILQREEYGYIPPAPETVTFETVAEDKRFCASKAVFQKVYAHCTLNGKSFSFPFCSVIPAKSGKHPIIVHINFRDCVPDKYMPTEEIIDSGFACLSFCYKDVTADNGDMTDGLAGILYHDGTRADSDAGKLAMWAWAAMRVMDYAQTVPSLDTQKSIVCGHSRLGKTALLAGAADERFALVYSNDSGCSGAALSSDKGESIEAITDRFPFWFCKNYLKYRGADGKMPFDQHYLASCICPRKLYIASAKEDMWADPESEFLCCVAADQAYRNAGIVGFVCDSRLPDAPSVLHGGNIAYHIREGTHYFSREDWLYLMKYANQVL